MRLTKCDLRHYYDADKYDSCPECARKKDDSIETNDEPVLREAVNLEINRTIALNQVLLSNTSKLNNKSITKEPSTENRYNITDDGDIKNRNIILKDIQKTDNSNADHIQISIENPSNTVLEETVNINNTPKEKIGQKSQAPKIKVRKVKVHFKTTDKNIDIINCDENIVTSKTMSETSFSSKVKKSEKVIDGNSNENIKGTSAITAKDRTEDNCVSTPTIKATPKFKEKSYSELNGQIKDNESVVVPKKEDIEDLASAFIKSLPKELRDKYSDVNSLMKALSSDAMAPLADEKKKDVEILNNEIRKNSNKENEEDGILDTEPQEFKDYEPEINDQIVNVSLDEKTKRSDSKFLKLKELLNTDISTIKEKNILFKSEGYTFYGNMAIDKNGTLIKYFGTEKEIIIPDNVITIGKYAFKSNQYVETIIVPDSVQMIEGFAFSFCTNLKKIELSNNLHTIGENAFLKCEKIQNIELPNTISRVGKGCFGRCTGLERIKLSSSLKRITSFCFSGCISLVKIDILYGVESIGENAFSGCNSLKKVIIPETLKIIESNSFSWCQSLSHIDLTHVVSIGNWAFYGCQKLREFPISLNAKDIKKDAFFGCEGIIDIKVIEMNNPNLSSIDLRKCYKLIMKILRQINEAKADRYAREHNLGLFI